MNKLTGAMTVAATLVAGIALAAPASAATNPYTQYSVCGSGYHELDHHALTSSVVYLMYNGATDCVVTIKTKYIGTKTDTESILEVRSNPIEVADDEGNYAYYAASSVRAPGICIKWGGMDRDSVWESPVWDHCG
jgi:hypothetical protein